MIRTFFLIIQLCLICFSVYGQNEKKQINNIKRNPEYVYGIGKSSHLSESVEQARLEVIDKIKQLSSDFKADVNIDELLSNILEKIESISYKDANYDAYLTLCFTNISNIPFLCLQKDITDSIETEVVPDCDLQIVEVSSVANVVDTISLVNPDSIDASFKDLKEIELIAPILELYNFKQVATYLKKIDNYKIEYNAVRQYDENIIAYWVVFNNEKKIIALLNKDRSIDYYNKQSVFYGQYKNNPQIWIQIIE